MPSRITLKEIEALLKKGVIDGELLKDVDAVMGAVTFFAPMVAGLPPGTLDVIAGVFGTRESLIQSGERLITRLSGIGAGSEVDRYRAIESAHLLVCYSAFFDAVADEIPDFWKTLSLLKSDQETLTRLAVQNAHSRNLVPPLPPIQHPFTVFRAQLVELRYFYSTLAPTVERYLEMLKIADVQAARKAGQYAAIKNAIVDRAIERYQAQYVELAKKFPEFHIYATFHFQREMDERIRALAEVATTHRSEADTGFSRLATAIEQIGRAPASQALVDLRRIYNDNIEQPILPKPVLGLTLPRRRDIFIPQAYRAIRYTTGMRLDLDETWNKCPVEEDLGPFIERCLESPHTVDKPILILGQPGSGKSMLTHMIGSIFAGRFDTVRVELRSVPADAKIYTQIEHFLSIETQGRRVTWPELRDQFTAAPVVILDGLDELLQATGRVFGAYLQDCADFQSHSFALDRPVRTIVTSRIALIGRTHVPEDTIVIKLEEFDAARRRQWVDLWNRSNASYFGNADNKTMPLDLEPLHPELRVMSRQPLLLLLLAIYDADRNPTRNADLNRTALYHNIVRSFVKREEERDPIFNGLSVEEQTERVDLEMRRLAVAGLTMFHHGKREITRGQVDRALDAFAATYPTTEVGQPLGQAERLFGRFFFVMKAETKVSVGDSTYEFLHATFGEFLAAYLIAWRVIDTCESIAALKPSERRDYIRKPDSFPNTWFECLMHAPLFNEPVVLGMLKEWLPQAAGENLESVKAQLQAVVIGQASMLLEGDRFPHNFKTLPALGHAAVYSVNLVTIAAVVNGSFVFDEQAFRAYPGQTRPWDRLTHLWRSWFVTGQLAALGGVLESRRDVDTVTISAEPPELVFWKTRGVEVLHAAASGLGDNVLLGLSGYFLADTIGRREPTLDDVDRALGREGYSIEEFTNFRRVPIEHGLKAQSHLLSIVNAARLDNSEIFARALWMLTSEPNRFIEWAQFPMVRELREIAAPLIAPTAGPKDCAVFYSEHSAAPAQLLFARRSGGDSRYKEAYERILAGRHRDWTPEETLIVYEAAGDFKDHDTRRRFRVVLEQHFKFTSLAKPTDSVNGYWMEQTAMVSDRWSQGAMRVANANGRSAEMNPYWPHAADGLRAVRRILGPSSMGRELLSLLANCLDLPIDIQVELLDIVRGANYQQADNTPWKLPIERLRGVSLQSYAAARRVAEWLKDEKAIEKLDQFVVR
jgi:hypothetical protein